MVATGDGAHAAHTHGTHAAQGRDSQHEWASVLSGGRGNHAHEHAGRETVDEHAARIRAMTETVLAMASELVPLADALYRVTAEAVLSPVDLPLFRNSQMDGFALRREELAVLPASFPIVAEIPAQPGIPAPLAPGTAARIMTGAVAPDGATIVVPVENATVEDGVVTVESVPSESYLRERGSDARAGDELLAAGLRLASRHLAVIAAAGLDEVTVRRRVRVGILTTGAELIEPGTPPATGQVFDANAVALAAAIDAAGADVGYRERVADDVVAFSAALERAVAVCDLVVTSGGISEGAYEVVRETLEPLGARVVHIQMQPGGPQATAVFDGTPIIGFPGNPVSTQLSFEILLAPLLRSVAGLPAAVVERRELAVNVTSVPNRRQYLRARLRPDGTVEPVSGPGSHLVAGLAASDRLIVLAESAGFVAAGEIVETLLL
jgi:molybdopterin molybdotransferase